MNFALLGHAPELVPLLRVIADSQQHALTAVALGDAAAIQALAPNAAIVDDWQALLLASDLSAVIVAGHAPEIVDGARGLARGGVPLIILPDVRQTAAFAYDLWPVEDEGRAVLCPLFAHDLTGDAITIAKQQRATDLGFVRFVQLERTLPNGPDNLLDLADVENALLHDADLLRRLFGNYSRITCVPVGLADRRVAVMTVTLAGDGLPEVTWRCTAATGASAATLSVSGNRGSFTSKPGDAGAGVKAAADAGLTLMEQRLAGSAQRPRWTDVVRAFDIADAARRSIRRRRTIEIGSEEISEVRQFKSLMTAAGCGVLMWTLFGTMALLLVGALVDPRDAAQRRAESAGFILPRAEFVAGAAALNDAGAAHVKLIAPRLWQTTADVVIVSETDALDAERRAVVEAALTAAGASSAERRVVARSLQGVWFQRAMLGLWVVVFGPLVVLLLLQLIGLAARPDL